MTYEKQNWECGDKITADKLNHMEDGIANAGGGMIVDVALVNGVFTMNKTFAEIHTALKDGIPCYARYAQEPNDGIDEDYVSNEALYPIEFAYKYNTDYRIYAASIHPTYSSSSQTVLGTPACVVFEAAISTDYPTFLKRVLVKLSSCDEDPNMY